MIFCHSVHHWKSRVDKTGKGQTHSWTRQSNGDGLVGLSKALAGPLAVFDDAHQADEPSGGILWRYLATRSLSTGRGCPRFLSWELCLALGTDANPLSQWPKYSAGKPVFKQSLPRYWRMKFTVACAQVILLCINHLLLIREQTSPCVFCSLGVF